MKKKLEEQENMALGFSHVEVDGCPRGGGEDGRKNI